MAVLGLLWFWARMSKATRPHSLLGTCEQTLLRVFIIVFFLSGEIAIAPDMAATAKNSLQAFLFPSRITFGS